MEAASTSAGSVEQPKMIPESSPVGSIEDINPIRQPEERIRPTALSRYESSDQNRPCGDLLEKRDSYNKICVPLYKASIKGDWKAAQVIFDKYPELVRYGINETYDTALHVAASCKSSKAVEIFVKNLVNKMTPEDLELENQNNNTALCLAVTAGNLKSVMTMLSKNPNLTDIPGSNQMMPLYMASLFGERELVNYLYDNSRTMSGDSWTHMNRSWVFLKCVENDIFDVALKMASQWPELGANGSALGLLARKTDAFRGTKSGLIWRIIRPIFAFIDVKVGLSEKPSDAMKLLRVLLANIVQLPKDTIASIMRGPADPPIAYAEKPSQQRPKFSSRILFVAAEVGNTEYLVEVIGQYPDLIWRTNDHGHTIFHVAARHRHMDIYNLVHEIGSMKDMITPLKDENGNNMLHLVGKCAKKNQYQNDSGVGLQMQSELLWFKEVEALLPPSYRYRKNKDGLTPHELFRKEHKDLLIMNEKWMKDTANQCLVVATLIASVAFAAAFGVPGGYNQNTGIPMFQHDRSFIAFAISDAISLAFSAISILIFLSIFISRYAELDFLVSLPKKLMTGLATLFFSISAMLVAFAVSFYTIFQGKFIWVPIIITIVISIPVVLYARLQYNLLGDVYRATYGSKYIFKPKKQRLYCDNPRF